MLTDKGKPAGRKWSSMLIGCIMLIIGLAVFKYLKIGFEHYWTFVAGVLGVTEGYGVLNVLNKKISNGGSK